MSREIKFRHIKPDGSVEFEQLNREMSGGIIEQYTGLKDKNGKEIYEGDIVNIELHFGSDNEYIKGVIRFERGLFTVQTLIAEIPDPLVAMHRRAEVIGNIHENPELLGGEG